MADNREAACRQGASALFAIECVSAIGLVLPLARASGNWIHCAFLAVLHVALWSGLSVCALSKQANDRCPNQP